MKLRHIGEVKRHNTSVGIIEIDKNNEVEVTEEQGAFLVQHLSKFFVPAKVTTATLKPKA